MELNYFLDYDAFIRSIKRNVDTSHAFLLGAGASISSGVQSATDCIWEWKRDIFTTKNPTLAGFYNDIKTESVKDAIQSWLDNEGVYPKRNSHEEYSFFANKSYPIADDRRKYFQSLSDKKEPYVGYKLLALLAEAEIVKSIWSTNFDGLVVKVAHQMNITPIEVTLESVERIYRNASRSELLSVALHGDYKYGELKNTAPELDSQNEIFIKTLVRYLNDKNLIVIGYSGRDRSLMQALKSAFSEKGSGRLYWCSYGSEVSEEIEDLIKHTRSQGREAWVVSTDGFDKTMIHLAKSCFETDDVRKKAINEILNTAKDDSIKLTPFSIDVNHLSYFIKSNLHPISLPKEVFQFEIEYMPDEGPWALLKDVSKDIELVAVPFKRMVYAISTKSVINQAFDGRLKSDIVRVPISKYDIQKVSVFRELMIRSILKGLAKMRGVQTDNRSKLWLSDAESTVEQDGQTIYIHKSVQISLFFDSKFSYLSFKPDIQLISETDISKDIRQAIGKKYFEKLFNNKYDEFLDSWRNLLFENKKLSFEFPLNSGSALQFSISDRTPFAEIMISNSKYREKYPENYDQRQSLHRGIQFLEPQLVFTSKNLSSESKDFHPMRGLINYKPYDHPFNGKVFSNEVAIGVICPKPYAIRFNSFLNELNQKFKAGVNPDYLIDYPGFSFAYSIPLNIPVINDDRWLDISIGHTGKDAKDIALELARLITTKIDQLASNHKHLIISIFIPNEWQAYRKYDDEGERFNLHDYIKAFSAQRGVSTQLVEEDTLNDSLKCQIFWWLSLSLYVKSLRTPWVLANLDKSTAFAGIGYSINHLSNENKIVIGCSHIYNSQGQGLKYKLSKVEDYTLDRQSNPFLSYNEAYQFGVSIRELFLTSANELPKRVVVHKRTRFTNDEINGIKDSLTMAGIEKLDLIEITFEQDARYLATRIYNNQMQIDGFPISRGVCIVTEPNVALLWTHGIVPSVRNPSYKYYLGGRNIPTPLKIIKHYGESNINTIATEILGFTKMNWNTFDLYTKLPATIQSSNEIARIGNLLSRFEGRTYDYRYFI